jgi:micrococcal nuclease
VTALCQNAKQIILQRVDSDRYGRTIAHIHCDSVHLNWRQVEDGMAWCFPKYLKHRAECLAREVTAREAKRGLWRDTQPMAPWEFRAMKRADATQP